MTGLISIYGACGYNIWPVLLNVIWLLAGLIASIVMVDKWCEDYNCSVSPGGVALQGIITALWVYPHAGFMVQVMNGTLTQDKYVPHSCCCVTDTTRVDQQEESRVVVNQASPPKRQQGATNV